MNIQISLILFFMTFAVTLFSQDYAIDIDSFIILKGKIESKYELGFNEFSNSLKHLSHFGNIHDFVFKNLDQNRRKSDFHEYYPAFLMFICNEMDETYKTDIIDKINKDEIVRSYAFPLLKSCVFKSTRETCYFLEALSPLNFDSTNGPNQLYGSLMRLKKELKCKNLNIIQKYD